MKGLCEACGLEVPESGPDPCFGELPGVMAACCGHGGQDDETLSEPYPSTPYIKFNNGVAIYFSGPLYGVYRDCSNFDRQAALDWCRRCEKREGDDGKR